MGLVTVRILGWLVIAHGLSHAVLPLRGSLAPTITVGDWMPVGLYLASMLGFLVAGVGILGMRPFDRAISPLLVLSSGLSLVGIARLGDPSLWPGGVFDVALLLTGLWRAYAGWPAHPTHGRYWHAAGVLLGAALLTYVATATMLFPWHRTWGSTPEELAMSLPGDPGVRDRALEVQHAVTIDAPPERVWPWLVQIGQDRAGFYSYEWLERAFGADVRNVLEVRPEWQRRDVGDFVRATQRGYLGGMFGPDLGWTVKAVEPDRALVLENWGAFVLQPTGDGRTRFIVRSTVSNRAIPVWASVANMLAFQMPHFVMERRMMLTIKQLAERDERVVAVR